MSILLRWRAVWDAAAVRCNCSPAGKHAHATCCSIVAAYTTRSRLGARCVTYMDESALRDFLFGTNSKTDGILQLFVDQSCHLNTDAASERPWDYGVDAMPRRK